MTDRELADLAWKEFQQVDRPWSAVAGYPPAKLAKTHWGRGKGYLDMIGRNVVAPPAAPLPPPSSSGISLGFSLFARMPESSGSTTNVANQSQLTTAIAGASAGSIINITANINGGGSALTINCNGSSLNPVTIKCDPGVLLTNFSQILLQGTYIRLRGLDIGSATVDGIKIDNGHDFEIDGCTVHNSTRQGINVQVGGGTPSNIQIWNCVVHSNGSQANGNLDHGTYFAVVSGNCLIANCLYYNNCAYDIQIYPNSPGLVVTGCTMDGGQVHAGGRGGIVIGSETGLTDNVLVVGVISTNQPQGVVDVYDPGAGDTGNSVYDSLGYGNSGTDFVTGGGVTYTNCSHADPLYTNAGTRDYRPASGSPALTKVQTARYGYLPATYRNGTARQTACAGSEVPA